MEFLSPRRPARSPAIVIAGLDPAIHATARLAQRPP
jgi:hypothetical protein